MQAENSSAPNTSTIVSVAVRYSQPSTHHRRKSLSTLGKVERGLHQYDSDRKPDKIFMNNYKLLNRPWARAIAPFFFILLLIYFLILQGNVEIPSILRSQ